MTVANINPPESIAIDETGIPSKEFIRICGELRADCLGLGEKVEVFVKTMDDNGKPVIMGYALSISSERLEDATEDGTGRVYLVTARKRLRLFKTLDAVSNYLGENGIFSFNVCTVL